MPAPASMPDPRDRDYRNIEGTLVVHWRPSLCVHCNACHQGLPSVFDPSVRPWVSVNVASPQRIIEQIDQCPSGALSYSLPRETPDPRQTTLDF